MSAPSASGTVLVTGSSTGIGEACALHLAGIGFDVLAGVRSPDDARRLDEHPGVTPVTLDVTDSAAVAAAAEAAAAAGGGRLAGLVNNAGIAIAAPLELVPLDELRRQLEVNVVGQVAVTQAMLPLLRAARGRVVNIGSVGGLVALPMLGPYAASKFALEAVTDALRREVASQGIRVAIVEPASVRTPIWDKSEGVADEMAAGTGAEAERLYGSLIRAIRAGAEQARVEGLPPRAVAEVVAEALTAPRPHTRYPVGREARGRAIAARVLPDRALDRAIARRLREGR